ncbi:MAG: exosome complex exonuclease Rrp41 [Candidatus Bathyarchaeia archaeon]
MKPEGLVLINNEGLRTDGRAPNELRKTEIILGYLKHANGSVYYKQGNTKIVAAVFGPSEAHPRHLALPDRAILRVRYHMAPFSVEERKSPAPTRREVELSMVIRNALEPIVISELFPKTLIDVFIEVIQADGGTRGAGVTAAALALADAGIPLRSLVAACAAGKVDGRVVLDLNDLEDKYGEADMPVAYLPTLNKISLLQMDGKMRIDEFKEALSIAINGCMMLYQTQVGSIRNKYMLEDQG